MRGALIVLGIATFASTLVGRELSSQAPAGEASPFYCNRHALSAAARTRHFDELGPRLRRTVTAVTELPDGYAFRFPADPETVQTVAEWAAGERLCCPFFDIAIRMDREGGPMWLTLTGREGTKAFIEADLAGWMTKP